MSDSSQNGIRQSSSKRLRHFSTSVTTRRRNASGHRTTSSTAQHSTRSRRAVRSLPLIAGGEATFDSRQCRSGDAVPRDGGGQFTLRVFDCTKPVIAAINGPAVGVGATMTLPMDIRLAADDARVGFVFARRGIVPEACSSWFLPRLVGISRAMEWVSTGRVFGADEAFDAGLVRSLHPKAQLLGAARAIAAEIAENAAPVSVAIARQMMWRMLGAGHPMPRTAPTRGGCSCAGSRPTPRRASDHSWRSARRPFRIASATACRRSCPGGARRSSSSARSRSGVTVSCRRSTRRSPWRELGR